MVTGGLTIVFYATIRVGDRYNDPTEGRVKTIARNSSLQGTGSANPHHSGSAVLVGSAGSLFFDARACRFGVFRVYPLTFNLL